MRADWHRIITVTPKSVEQCRDELFEKLNWKFTVYSSLLSRLSPSRIRLTTTHAVGR
jgi:hypothetical protein